MSAPAPAATHSARTAPAAHHHEHAAHDHPAHHTVPAPLPEPSGDCPHCLGSHAAGNVPNADCAAVAAAPFAAAQALPAAKLVLPVANHVPLATSAVPPLIRTAAPADAAPSPSVPLHIRHCVLLI
jgi:hypothetical protein